MRKEAASLLALVALSLAESELTTNDVPLPCANICGPIVELSSLCDIDGSTRHLELKKRKLARGLTREDVPPKDPKAKAKRQLLPETVTIDQPRNGVIGQFKTITSGITPTGVPPFNRPPTTELPVAAPPPPVQQPAQPANPNGDLVGQVPAQPVTQTFNLRPTTTPTFINPLFPSLVPPQTQPAPPLVETPPQAGQPPTTTTILPISSSIPGGIGNIPVGDGGGAVSPSRGLIDGGERGDAGDGDDDGRGEVADDVGDIKDDAGALWPGQKQKQDEDREVRCFCTNESFEVARVAALCASCISQVGDENSPMKGILSQCNFTAEEYEPAKERVVANVQVRASSGAFSLTPTRGLAMAGVVLGLVGLAEMLL